MGNLQRMALQMQQEMTRIQAELGEARVEGTAGGGVVRAVVTGKQSRGRPRTSSEWTARGRGPRQWK